MIAVFGLLSCVMRPYKKERAAMELLLREPPPANTSCCFAERQIRTQGNPRYTPPITLSPTYNDGTASSNPCNPTEGRRCPCRWRHRLRQCARRKLQFARP